MLIRSPTSCPVDASGLRPKIHGNCSEALKTGQNYSWIVCDSTSRPLGAVTGTGEDVEMGFHAERIIADQVIGEIKSVDRPFTRNSF